MQNAEPGSNHSDRWTYGIAIAVVLLVAGYFLRAWLQAEPAEPQSPLAQVQRQAAERMAGVRCIGAKASRPEKDAIARLLAVNTVAPRGSLPPWLPSAYALPATGPAGADVWQRLADACPDAPAFGTPFGFPSAEIEKELRQDAEFAALSDSQWADIKRYEAGAGQGVAPLRQR